MFKVPEKYRIETGSLATGESAGNNGAFIFSYSGMSVLCVASDILGWEHVSVTAANPGARIPKNPPSWKIMRKVKSLFWDDEDAVMQIHPPKSEYVNFHPACLHLWRPVDGDFPRPPRELVNGGLMDYKKRLKNKPD